jgi:hypothetical protein
MKTTTTIKEQGEEQQKGIVKRWKNYEKTIKQLD